MYNQTKVAIIGGGVSGVTTALHLAQRGVDVTLFERKSSLVDGPPWCHLHAGGNLYREISDEQCVTLLKQSIDFVKFYPYVVDYRPTVIALPLEDKQRPQALFSRLNMLQATYEKLVVEDEANRVLGEPHYYYALYSRKKMEHLKSLQSVDKPSSLDEWMIPVAQHIDLNNVQYPLIMVQEYGLNIFRLASGAMLSMQYLNNVDIKTNHTIEDISKKDEKWILAYDNGTNQPSQTEAFDYIVNATGFKTGTIDDMVGVRANRMVEFKASYVSYWENKKATAFPEIIFHGERGTPKGMAQFTPYPNGYFQLHGMTQNITLFEDGLVKSDAHTAQPKLNEHFIQKVDKGWSEEEFVQRTQKAIAHVTQFIPSFREASVGSQPLFGAQQITGDDPTLRVAEVAFPRKAYARCEIVKVSSSIDMANAIVEDLVALGYIDALDTNYHTPIKIKHPLEEALKMYAQSIARERGYPASMAQRNVANPSFDKEIQRRPYETTHLDYRQQQWHRA